MKKLFCLLISLNLILLCGCNNISSDVTAVTTELNFTAEIEYKNEKYEYKVQIPKKSTMLMETVYPEKLKGTVLEFSDSLVTVNCNGIKHSTELSAIPSASVIGFIYAVFSDADTKREDVTLENDEFYISGETQGYRYKLYFGTTGLPIKIVDSKNGITAIIKGATIQKG